MKRKKMKFLSGVLLFFIISLPLFPQSGNEDGILIKQLDLSGSVSIDPAFSSQSVIMQRGDFNNGAIVQTNFGLNINAAEIYQSGFYNDAFVIQNGSGNVSVTRQKGIDNSYSLNITGDGNRIFTEQRGSNNELNQEIAAFGLRYIVIQNGNNLSFTQIENTSDSRAYEVTQNGNGMKIILINRNLK